MSPRGPPQPLICYQAAVWTSFILSWADAVSTCLLIFPQITRVFRGGGEALLRYRPAGDSLCLGEVLLTWIASATCLHNTQFQLATEGMLDELGAGSSGWRETDQACLVLDCHHGKHWGRPG